MIKFIFLIFSFFGHFANNFIYSQNTVSIPFTVDNANLINVKIILNSNYSRTFIFDTGASGIVINSALFTIMQNAGSITTSDILGTTHVIIANGSQAQAQIIQLKSISIGGFVISNIQAFVMPDPTAPLLIGQSVFSTFGKISIDYNKQEIILDKSNTPISQIIKINIKEIRLIPCSSNKIKELSYLQKLINDSISVKSFTKETNVPPPTKALNRVNSGITIRYFDNQDYQTALQIKKLLQSDLKFSKSAIDIENMLPYFKYKSIPNYVEIWLK